MPISKIIFASLFLCFVRWTEVLAIDIDYATSNPQTNNQEIGGMERYDATVAQFEKELAEAEKKYGPDGRPVSSILIKLAQLHLTRGQYQRAEPLFNRALFIREKIYKASPSDLAFSMKLVGISYLGYRQYEQAEALFLKSMNISEKESPPDISAMQGTANTLAQMYLSQGKSQQAELILNRLLKISETTFGKDDFGINDI